MTPALWTLIDLGLGLASAWFAWVDWRRTRRGLAPRQWWWAWGLAALVFFAFAALAPGGASRS